VTPLAHRLARCLSTMPADFNAVAVPALTDAHFFEVTAALPLFNEINAAALKLRQAGEPFTPTTFLPAPNTWLEWREANGLRIAASLCETGNPANMRLFFEEARGTYVTIELGVLDFQTGRLSATVEADAASEGELPKERLRKLARIACVSLAVVNSPNIVNRRTHPPHKRLARKLGVGIGPLHDWHEIKLEVTKPRDICDGESHADVLTGRRALHFVRKFIRIRLGKLEYVREHWRGDASIGIRRGRYVVTA
jgi:hypothetical protein